MMLDVARNGGEDRPVSLATVAERTGISRGYLEQLALALRNARLVRGVAGRYGGYKLAEPASSITIGQIIESAIGPVCLVDCLEDPTTCPRAEWCECRVVYELINDRIAEVLREYTLADLLDPSWTQLGGKNAIGRGLLADDPLPMSGLDDDETAADDCPQRGARQR
jgi:Rrf2 family protein